MTSDWSVVVSVAALALSTAALLRTYRARRIRLNGREIHRAIQDYKRRIGTPFEGDSE